MTRRAGGGGRLLVEPPVQGEARAQELEAVADPDVDHRKGLDLGVELSEVVGRVGQRLGYQRGIRAAALRKDTGEPAPGQLYTVARFQLGKVLQPQEAYQAAIAAGNVDQVGPLPI